MAQQQRAYSGGRGGGKAHTTFDGKLTPKGLQALRAWAKDADFNESNVKRDEGGKFSAQQHQAAASQHSATAAKHPDKQVAKAHADAAKAHTLAAKHIAAQTGWQWHNAQKAHNATKAAEQAEASAGGAANAEQLKAVASDPSKPLAARAEAVKQLEVMQAQADAVAGSPLAVPQPKPAAAAPGQLNISPAMKAKLAGALKPAANPLYDKPQGSAGVPAPAPKAKEPRAPRAISGAKLDAYIASFAKAKAAGTTPTAPAAPAAPVNGGLGGSNWRRQPFAPVDKKSAASAYKGTSAGPLHINTTSEKKDKLAGALKLGPDMPGHKIPPKPFTYSAAAHPVGSRVGFTYGGGSKGTGTVLSHHAEGMKVKSDIGENEHMVDARNDPRRLDSTPTKK